MKMKINNCKLCEIYDNQKLSGDKGSNINAQPQFCRHTSAAAAAFLSPNFRDFLAFHLLRGKYQVLVIFISFVCLLTPPWWLRLLIDVEIMISILDNVRRHKRKARRRRIMMIVDLIYEKNELAISIIRGRFFCVRWKGSRSSSSPLLMSIIFSFCTYKDISIGGILWNVLRGSKIENLQNERKVNNFLGRKRTFYYIKKIFFSVNFGNISFLIEWGEVLTRSQERFNKTRLNSQQLFYQTCRILLTIPIQPYTNLENHNRQQTKHIRKVKEEEKNFLKWMKNLRSWGLALFFSAVKMFISILPGFYSVKSLRWL